MNDTKKAEEKPVILSELLKLVAKCEKTYGQRQVYQRVKALVMGELFAFGRHTITQLLMSLGGWRMTGVRGIAYSVKGGMMKRRQAG